MPHVPWTHVLKPPFIGIIPVSVYDALPYERSTRLKQMVTSPLHYQQSARFDNRSMSLGTVVHTAVLEPWRFAEEYVTFPGAVRRGKKWDEFQAENTGRSIVTDEEMETARDMATAIRGSPGCYWILNRPSAATEVTLIWVDKETGITCKARIDHLSEDQGRPVLTGLKTARSVDAEKFAAQSVALNYHLSWAMYRAGFEEVTGKDPLMLELAIENHPPYDAVPYQIGYGLLSLGDDLYRGALRRLKRCRESGEWPGQAEGVTMLEPPAWAYDDDGPDVGL